MAIVLSRGIIIVAIYIYTLSVSDARNGCTDLVISCFNKFNHLHGNASCGDLKDAINCISTSDMAVCELSSVNHTIGAERNQSFQHVNSNSDAYKSHPEPYESGKGHEQQSENNGNGNILNTKSKHYDTASGSNSGLDGTLYGDNGSQNEEFKKYEESAADYITTLIDLIEDAKVLYNNDCNVNNVGARGSPTTWPAILCLIGVFATVHM